MEELYGSAQIRGGGVYIYGSVQIGLAQIRGRGVYGSAKISIKITKGVWSNVISVTREWGVPNFHIKVLNVTPEWPHSRNMGQKIYCLRLIIEMTLI